MERSVSLKEQVYSVLVVSAAERFNESLSSFLSAQRCDPVQFVSGVSAARRAWNGRFYDIVIVNSPLPDETGIRFAVDVSASSHAVVLLLTRPEAFADTRDRVAAHGVFTLVKPLSRQTFAVALDWMIAARERLRKLEKKAISFEEKMEEIRLVNRAKWLLISELKMDEAQAHRYIEKQAMDKCLSRREIAETIVKTYT